MEITFYLGRVMINKGNNVLVVEDTTIKGGNKSGVGNKSFEEMDEILYCSYYGS